MKPSVYLETTIPSYSTSRPSRDLVTAANQQITREWWERRRHEFQLYISALVIDEVSAGDEAAPRDRVETVKTIPLLDITTDVDALAASILASGKLPKKAALDAAHIAIAAVHRIDFLLTWNCVHIANAAILKPLAKVCQDNGCECPVICTPQEFLGEWKHVQGRDR